MQGKVKATGRRVMSKTMVTQYEEILEETIEVQRIGMQPAGSIESMREYWIKLSQVARKQVLFLDKVIAQEITLETFLEQTEEGRSKAVNNSEEDSDIN